MRNERKPYFEAISQIAIMIIAIFAFSYLVSESAQNSKTGATGIKAIALLALEAIVKILFSEKTLVSAASGIEINTCAKTIGGKICVEYASAGECAAQCAVGCIPAKMSETNDCRIGSCFDPVEGTCMPNSPKGACETNGGTWLSDANANTKQCAKGCCLSAGQAVFTTERRCERISSVLGISRIFKPEIKTESACVSSSGALVEGACILGKDSISGKNLCRFVTRELCIQLKGQFYKGALCSNPDLNSVCEKQKKSGCIEGKDEVYWIDSCGNRENIYDANKARSWNNGMILSKEESCQLDSGIDLLNNQGTCGNCNYFKGSKCGDKTSSEKLSDSTQNYVCRDLRCDDNGKIRQNGESWCEYQGAIGVDEGRTRSTDTPGSRHFRKICINGEIRREACADYRNEICTESKNPLESGATFSVSACQVNPWQECISYNLLESAEEKVKKCNENAWCYVKSTNIDKNFKFNLCMPKYPGGHNLQTGDGGEFCALASQKCVVVEVKEIFKGWECKANCKCKKIGEEFTRQMNDLCMSLGDCGAEANYIGDLSESYNVRLAPRLGKDYLKGLASYAEPVPGKSAEPVIGSFSGELGLPNNLGGITKTEKELAKQEQNLANLLLYGPTAVSGLGGVLTLTKSLLPKAAAAGKVGSVLGALGSITTGMGIGFALTTFLLKEGDVGRGMPTWMVYTLIGIGTAGGGIAGGAIFAMTMGIGGATSALGIGLAIVAAVSIFILIARSAGVGHMRKLPYEFTCKLWEPPRGGKNCGKCGADGFPCSQYSCESLGQTCKLVNENTPEEKCIDSAPNDIGPPAITPIINITSGDYKYFEVGDSGVQIKSASGDGCMPAYSTVMIGLSLNKYGKCKYSGEPGTDYNEMNDDFGAGKFSDRQYSIFTIPSLEMLGLESYNPSQRAEMSIYVKCENANGYHSEKDYAINFCIKPGEDITPPLISIAKPASEFIKYGAKTQDVIAYTNEPAECKWDFTGSKNYEMMTNDFECANGFSEQELPGWKCNATIPVRENAVTAYVKCKDKPWEENETKRNANSESVAVAMRKTSELKIESATPDKQTLEFGVVPASVAVNAKTSGGVDGMAICEYSFDGVSYANFFETGVQWHSQIFESFTEGDKKIIIKCEDSVGNSAEKSISFSVSLDNDAPKITRVYRDGSSLVIKTNEDAECFLSNSTCDFDFNEASQMNGEGIAHSILVSPQIKYFAKCKDEFDNYAGECDMTIIPISASSSAGGGL